MRPAREAIDPIARLAQEHGVIFSVIDAFERCAEMYQIGNAAAGDLVRFVLFFREYGERIHHQKEETIAFAALSPHGFHEERGPRADLHDQHSREQSLVARITRRVIAEAPPSDADREQIVSLVASFCALQREHIKSENDHFYPALRKLLSSEESQLMAEKLERFDKEHNRDGTLDWLLELAEELEFKFSGPSTSE